MFVKYRFEMCLFLSQLFPACFVLMESKSDVAYRHLFQLLKDLAPGLSPPNLVTDFEAALVSPIADLFPNTRHQGCWFHYCQVSLSVTKYIEVS